MDTMKNIHPIYNIKVRQSSGGGGAVDGEGGSVDREGGSVDGGGQWTRGRLFSCPMKTFSILVLDHLTEIQLSRFDSHGWLNLGLRTQKRRPFFPSGVTVHMKPSSQNLRFLKFKNM